MLLKLVPPTVPDRLTAMKNRLKALPRPDGLCQCPRCGNRSMLTEKSGVFIKAGRKSGGTVIVKDVCAACYRAGIYSPMVPTLEPVSPSKVVPRKR